MKNYGVLARMVILVISSFFFPGIFAQVCPAGLVSYWNMDETEGIILLDKTGDHHATSNVELTVDESSMVGTSHYFYTSGTFTGNKAVVPNASAYSFPANSSFTIAYWVKFTEIDYNLENHVIISKGDYRNGTPSGAFWSSGINILGNINFILQDSYGNRQNLETSSTYNDGAWHMVAFVRDAASENSYLYIDGVVKSQINYNFSGHFTIPDDIQICNLKNTVGGNLTYSYFYRGSLDEVAIYNRALSSLEISSQFALAGNGMGICDGPNPRISSIPKTTAIVGTPYAYTVKAGGIPTGMNFTLLVKPSGMTINSTTGVISWTPASTDVNGLVSVRADNGMAPADTQTFRIYVAEGTVCPDNLILLLKLDEKSGPVYADHYLAHDATASVSPVTTTGKINGAQIFNGTTKMDIPDIGTEFDWTYNASFSFEFWLQTNTSSTMVCIARHRLDYDNVAFFYVGTDQVSGTHAEFELRDNGGVLNTLTGTSIINDGAWHHIVAVRNGATKLNKLYVDGVEEASIYVNYANSFMADLPTPLNIGYLNREFEGEAEYHLVGALDEVAVYNRAVTATEAASFYNGGNPDGHCAAGNFAPVFTSIPVTSATEGVNYSYTAVTEDIDTEDVLTISAITKPSWLTWNAVAGQKTATLTGTPGHSHIGDHIVTLGVSDGHKETQQTYTITVGNIFHDPVVTSTPQTNTDEDTPYSYTLTVTDSDAEDVINMSAVNLPSWLNFVSVSGSKSAVISGTPDDMDIGTQEVKISITDGHATIYEIYNLTVNAVNDPPVITAQAALNTDEEVAINLQKLDFTITDADNPSSDITIQVQPGTNYSNSGNTVTPDVDFSGQLTVNLIAGDLNDDSQVFHAMVSVNPVNDPPEITSEAEPVAIIDELYAYVFTANDVDDQNLTKSVIQKPDWLSFSENLGILSGSPSISDIGYHVVKLRVSDGKVDVDQNFTILVEVPDGLVDLEEAGIHIYPVPAKDYLHIQFGKTFESAQLEVINANGKVILKAMVPANIYTFRLDLNEVETGIYYLHISNKVLNNIGRIIIVK